MPIVGQVAKIEVRRVEFMIGTAREDAAQRCYYQRGTDPMPSA
jgi:hypothetical protein